MLWAVWMILNKYTNTWCWWHASTFLIVNVLQCTTCTVYTVIQWFGEWLWRAHGKAFLFLLFLVLPLEIWELLKIWGSMGEMGDVQISSAGWGRVPGGYRNLYKMYWNIATNIKHFRLHHISSYIGSNLASSIKL